MRDFILWRRKGRFELGRAIRLPGIVSSLLADQDGLFGAACVQYRESMNDVAVWAKDRDLIDHTGDDCVPRQVSLLEAHVNRPARVTLLQRSDGYGPDLDVGAELPNSYQHPAADIEALISAVPIFALLAPAERVALARAAHPLTLGPTERLIVQGQEGGSLFVVAEGEVEVVLRCEDGSDLGVDTMGKGGGRRRDVAAHGRAPQRDRARGGGRRGVRDRQRAVRADPGRAFGTRGLMAERLAERRKRLDAYAADCEPRALARRIRDVLLRI